MRKKEEQRNCGCHARDHRPNRLDLTGRKFGRLTALEPTERRDHKGSVYWKCLCDCGSEAEVSGDALVQGNSLSCGCLKRENQKEIVNKLHHVDGTCVEILENRKYRRDNTSGFRGVFRTKNGRFRADIGFKGRRFYLGTYESYEEAVKVRLEAEKMIHEGFLEAYYQWKKKAEEDPEWGETHPLLFEVGKTEDGLKIMK